MEGGMREEERRQKDSVKEVKKGCEINEVIKKLSR
jgi:hypothetical protein